MTKEKTYNILAIGDIVGKPGRKIVSQKIPWLKEHYKLHVLIANGENASGGMSLAPETVDELFSYGIDILTSGNHIWYNKDVIPYLKSEKYLVRPANYPDGVPGKGYCIYRVEMTNICVINLIGRVHMTPVDCPFRKFDEIYEEVKSEADIILIDFHAEATSEKQALGWYVKDRASALFGTHTHVQTADERILPGGTGYITDIGMAGAFDSVIGMKPDLSIESFLYQTRSKFEVATKNTKCNGLFLKINKSGKTEEITRVNI